MTGWRRACLGLCCGLGAFGIVALSTGAAVAQTYEPRRTPDGHPDFQGTWSNPWMTPIERLPEASSVVLDATEASRVQAIALARLDAAAPLNPDGYRNEGNLLAIVQGQHRAALVVDPPDGKLPYRPEARPAPFTLPPPPESYEVIGPNVRCTVGGGPMFYAPGNWLRTIVQTPDSLVIHSEAFSDLRVFRIGGAPRPAAVESRAGDSIARWEGDTLVVETTHVRAESPIRLSVGFTPLIFRNGARLIERFTLVGPDEMLYQFTVEDPAVYARPWMAEYAMIRTGERQFEHACHEGNYALTNILQGARVQERRTASAPTNR
jgi:hypothetical protein